MRPIEKVRKRCRTGFDIKFAFNNGLWRGFIRDTLGIGSEPFAAVGFDLLAAVGFTKREIEAANVPICGAMTVEGAAAPEGAENYPGFDCANPHAAGRQALSLGREPHPHEGGLEPHFGCDLENQKHAETEQRWRMAQSPPGSARPFRCGRGLHRHAPQMCTVGGLDLALGVNPTRRAGRIQHGHWPQSRCRELCLSRIKSSSPKVHW